MTKAISLAGVGFIVVSALGLTACQTISEDSCRAGNWQDIGYEDGTKGRSRSRLASIGETCAKYGIRPDRQAYLRGLEQGLDRYCSPDQGYRDGTNGGSPNKECRGLGYDDYLIAFDDGLIEYEARRDYSRLKDRWTDLEEDILTLEVRLDEPDLSRSDRREIRGDLRGLENERDDVRADIRAIERDFDWPRWRPEIPDSSDS